MKEEILIIILICIILFYNLEITENIETVRTLDKDGFYILYNKKYNAISDYPSNELISDALSQLPDGYMFIDYIYKIYDSSLFTFHRDVTSSKHIFNTKHPIYTLILYQTDGCLLSVCPGSHNTYPFVWSHIVNIKGNTGTAFLFDSDLLHAGCINDCIPRTVIQYKICHKDDLYLLHSLSGIRSEKKQICKNTIKNRILRKLSYYFEFPINYIFTPFMMKKHDPNTIMGTIQSCIPIDFYNNK